VRRAKSSPSVDGARTNSPGSSSAARGADAEAAAPSGGASGGAPAAAPAAGGWDFDFGALDAMLGFGGGEDDRRSGAQSAAPLSLDFAGAVARRNPLAARAQGSASAPPATAAAPPTETFAATLAAGETRLNPLARLQRDSGGGGGGAGGPPGGAPLPLLDAGALALPGSLAAVK
jgi:hypothetical protein